MMKSVQLLLLCLSAASAATTFPSNRNRADASEEASPSIRRRLPSEEREEAASSRGGFFDSIWNIITGGDWSFTPEIPRFKFSPLSGAWKEGDHDIEDLGAFVFEMSFNDTNPTTNELDTSRIAFKTVSENGIIGNKWNRYAWSSALDKDENLWIGTFNANMNLWNMTKFYMAVARAPLGRKWDAISDAFLRYFHGSPIFDSEGAQVTMYNGTDWNLMWQAPKQFVGFRSMTTHTVSDGEESIYLGSTNGPDEPSRLLQRYDWSWESGDGEGAKVFTNKGGEFHMLDDQGNLDGYDRSIRKMCVSSYSNRLFIGTETHECAKVLIHDVEKNTFKKIQQTGDDCKIAVSECLDIGDGKMLIGTWQNLGHALYVIDEKNDDAITKVNTPNLWYHMSCGVMELRVFKGQLYVGLLSFPRGFALIRTANLDVLNVQSSEWELITGNGFAKEQRKQLGARVSGNEYPWSSTEVNGVYLLGTMTISQRGISLKSSEVFGMQPQLWASKDGENWSLVKHPNQPGFLFGYRTMQTKSDGTVYIGSSSNLFQRYKKEEGEP